MHAHLVVYDELREIQALIDEYIQIRHLNTTSKPTNEDLRVYYGQERESEDSSDSEDSGEVR
jgi:hypothetical protein